MTPTGRRPAASAEPALLLVQGRRLGVPEPQLGVGLEDGSPQRRWLERKVRERGTCRIAFWHRPYLNAGKHGDQEDTAPLWRAVRGHAALVLNGHDHNFQHFKPRDGIVELSRVQAATSLYPSNQNDSRLVWDEDDEFGRAAA